MTAYNKRLDRTKYGYAEFKFVGKTVPLFKIDSCSDGSADDTYLKPWASLLNDEVLWNQVEDSNIFNSKELDMICMMPEKEFADCIHVILGD